MTLLQVRIIRNLTPQPICLELLEVGGAAKYSKYREFFFSFDIDAVFLVYDVSNKRQRKGIVHWEHMITEKLGKGHALRSYVCSIDREEIYI